MWNQRGQKRKSARISALEAAAEAAAAAASNKNKREKNKQQQQLEREGEGAASSHRNAPPPPPPRRAMPPPPPVVGGRHSLPEVKYVRKKKRLDEVGGPSVAPTPIQDQEAKIHGETSSIRATLPSRKPMPEKRMLEFILDVLQRRDTHEIFAQPVDPEKVEGYYSIIKEPMDFGTMRAKLQEGMYSSLEQFESDVFLISSNAMEFNSSATIYFRQARAIHELAKRVFNTLKTDPGKIEHEFSVARRRTDKKPQANNLRRNTRTYRGSSSSKVLHDHTDIDIYTGYRDGRKINLCGIESRQTYKPLTSLSSEKDLPSTVYGCPKLLVPGNGGIGYKESLMHFVQNLGPTARMVANRKLSCLSEVPHFQSLMPSSSVQNPHSQISSSSASQQEIPLPLPRDLRNFPGDSATTIDLVFPRRNSLAISIDDISGGGIREDLSLASDRTTSKGKNVISGERTEIYGGNPRGNMGSASAGKAGPTGDLMEIYRAACGEVGSPRTLTGDGSNISGGTRRGIMAPPADRTGIQALASKGKNVVTSDNISTYKSGFGGGRGHIHGGFREGSVLPFDMMGIRNTVRGERADVAAANTFGTTRTQIGSYRPSVESANLSGPISCTGKSGEYTRAGVIMGSSQLGCQAQPARSASESQSGPLESMVGGNRRPRSCVYPSIIVKPSVSNLDYGANSAQAGQPVEWTRPTPLSPQAIYGQPSQVNPLGKVGFASEEQQLTMDEFWQRQLLGRSTPVQGQPLVQSAPYTQSQQREVNRSGEGASRSAPYTQLLFGDENPLGQDALFQQELAQNLHSHPNGSNILSQDALAEPGTQFSANPWVQNSILQQRTPQGPMLDTENMYQRGPQQGQRGRMANPQLLQSFQQQASRGGTKYPDLNLQL